MYVCGTFNNWETKIPMTNRCVCVCVCVCGEREKFKLRHFFSSQGDFTVIVDLPEGEHQYKFYVDGDWLHNPDEVGPKSSAYILYMC